jgi:hypothetical protein
MADIKIAVDRQTDPPTIVISALPGTDSATYEAAKPHIKRVLDALGVGGVAFTPLTEIEQHIHPETTLVVDRAQLHTR